MFELQTSYCNFSNISSSPLSTPFVFTLLALIDGLGHRGEDVDLWCYKRTLSTRHSRGLDALIENSHSTCPNKKVGKFNQNVDIIFIGAHHTSLTDTAHGCYALDLLATQSLKFESNHEIIRCCIRIFRVRLRHRRG